MLCGHFNASSVQLQNECSTIKSDAAVIVFLSVIQSSLLDFLNGVLKVCKLQLPQLGGEKCVH